MSFPIDQPPDAADREQDRAQMVRRQLAARGIHDPLVLDAMSTTLREAFVPERCRASAYDDRPLPLAADQTISQPYIVAYMIEALQLRGGERVLEIGTGSGYAAAVLAAIAEEVYTVERIPKLAERARMTLDGLGYTGVHCRQADGSLGWPEHAPYDAILVSAGAPDVPQSLKSQLAIGGHLVIPVGPDSTEQKLLRVTRVSADTYLTDDIACVRFVPLIGAEAWEPDPDEALALPSPNKSTHRAG